MDKKRLVVGDVCILWQNYFPLDFVRIIDIELGAGDKPGWSNVSFIRNFGHISVPFGWLLDEDHLHQETFMLNGVPYKLELYSRMTFPTPDKKDKKESKYITVSDNKNTLF